VIQPYRITDDRNWIPVSFETVGKYHGKLAEYENKNILIDYFKQGYFNLTVPFDFIQLPSYHAGPSSAGKKRCGVKSSEERFVKV